MAGSLWPLVNLCGPRAGILRVRFGADGPLPPAPPSLSSGLMHPHLPTISVWMPRRHFKGIGLLSVALLAQPVAASCCLWPRLNACWTVRLLQPYLVPQQVAGCPLNCTGVQLLGLSHRPPSPGLRAATAPSTPDLFAPQGLCVCSSLFCSSPRRPQRPCPRLSVGHTLTTTFQITTLNTPHPPSYFFFSITYHPFT